MAKNERMSCTINGVQFTGSVRQLHSLCKMMVADAKGSATTKNAKAEVVFRPNAEIKRMIKAIQADNFAEFVLKVLHSGINPEGKGYHSVFSGINEIGRERYGVEPTAITTKLEAEGVIKIHPSSGGVTLKLA